MQHRASVVERQVHAAALQADRVAQFAVVRDGHAVAQADLLDAEALERALAGAVLAARELLHGRVFGACHHVGQQLLGGGLVDVAAVHGRTGQQLQRGVLRSGIHRQLGHQHADGAGVIVEAQHLVRVSQIARRLAGIDRFRVGVGPLEVRAHRSQGGRGEQSGRGRSGHGRHQSGHGKLLRGVSVEDTPRSEDELLPTRLTNDEGFITNEPRWTP